MSRPGPLNALEIATVQRSALAPFGAILFATGDDHCFWATLAGDITLDIDEGDSASSVAYEEYDEGDSASAHTASMDEGDST